MIYDLIQIAGLGVLCFAAWKQQGRIDDLEMMVGYTLSLMDKEEEKDVLPDRG